MKLTKEQEAEIWQVYDIWLTAYLNADVKTYNAYFDDDYHFIGSTINEEFLNRNDATTFFKQTGEQFAGIMDLRNEIKILEIFDTSIFITHFCDVWFINDKDRTYYGRFRLSSVMQKKNEDWRFIYQHFSMPDSKSDEGETIGFEKINAENVELKEAIKRRTIELETKNRELEIESALERVRSASMAMQSSEELASVARTVFEQLRVLGVDVYRSWIDIFRVNEGYVLTWSTDFKGNFQPNPATFPLDFDETMSDFYRDYKSSSKFIELEAHGDEVMEWFDYLYSVSSDPIFKMSHVPSDLYQIWAKHKYGTVATTKLSPISNDEKDILNRFANVFEQAYTRFLDLQKAEAQAREAQIEMALEKVRSRTMAMQSSDELTEAASEMFSQIEGLGLNPWSCGFNIFNDDKTVISQWVSTGDGRPIEPFDTPATEGIFKRIVEQSENDEPLYIEKMEGKKLEDTYKYMASLPTLDKIFEELDAAGIELPKKQVDHAAYFKQGYLMFITYDETPEFHSIFKRFAKVFEQTYTRFLDLQKTEAQAREAQIQLALERIRARTMAMQSSDELAEVSYLLNKQVVDLGIPTRGCAFNIYNEHDSTEWFSNLEGTIPTYKTPRENIFLKYYDAGQRGETLWIEEFGGDRIKEHYQYLATLALSGKEGETIESGVAQIPEYQIDHAAYFKYGYLLFITLEPAPEAHEVFKRFAKEFEQTYTRFLDLKKAEAQAREAQIETALEKVRSRTMAMQKGEELQEVAVLLYKELITLGVTNFVTCGYVEVNEDIKKQHTWVTAPGGDTMGLFHLPLTGDDTFDARYAAWKKQQTVFHQSVAGQVRSDHLEYAITTFNSKEAEEMVRSQFPDPTVFYCFNFSHGYLHLVGGSLLEKEEENLLARFTKVFEQTYTRFLDLQKAEEQAREAKIEMSLEKIRSRTMGMQSSDELPEVANMMFLEVQELGIPAWSCGYCILTDDRRASTCIMSTEGTVQKPFLLPHLGEPSFEEWDDFVHGDQTFFTQELKGEAIDSHYNFMTSLPQLKPVYQDLVDAGLSLPDYQINHLCKFSHGFLLFITYEEVPGSHDIFKRFTSVFEQTYTRFLDLKRAEKQTREAQIENALEKVRSRSLAMQHPNELVEVAQLLREEMGALGVEELETSSIYIHDDASGLTQCWFTIKDADDPGKSVTDQMIINLQNTWVGRQMNEFYDSGQDSTSILMKGEHRIEWIRYCEEKSDLFGKSEFYGETIPERTYHLYKFSNGFLGAASPGTISEESWDLMKRASGAFSFAYTRFSDLQKAEESARRARQQASLDRVRADISGMRSAEDLNRVTPLIWSELTTLGIPFIRCGIFIIQEEDKQIEVYLSKPDGTSLTVMHLPFGSNDLVSQTVDAWQQGSVYIQHWTREEFLEWGRSMIEQGQVSDLESYQGAETAPESLHLQFLPFNQGMLYVGSVNPLDDEEISLSESLAKAFSIAYARYEDFVKLERAKAGIEDALAELKATQSQLVQQEKLASLGQLTAGIAHEIKNPLNFVNNFSELSVELIEEAREEVKEKLSADSQQLTAILDDIETNLKTIHKHGSRADGIVKSMLQHSRGGDGKMESTPLNPLIKEYVNLAFHGMRAGKDPINVDIDLQLDENTGEIPLIAEDFSRVILNLCNNAFDAMREKGIKNSELKIKNYSPKLTVRTKAANGNMVVEIQDNGPGIPKEMKDKILQPFFTTKKGTAGTGLGLSITNDIIKAHGGGIEIKSFPGEGSIFTIQLPKQSL